MKSRRRLISLAVLAIAIGLVFVLAYSRAASAPSNPTSHVVEVDDEGASRPEATRRLRWRVGESRRYSLGSKSTVRVNPGAGIDPHHHVESQALHIDLEGAYQLDVLADLEGDAIVRGAFVPQRVHIETPNQGAVDESSELGRKMLGLLSTPLILRIGSTGRISGVRVPEALVSQRDVLVALKQIPAALQFVFPDSPGKHRWDGGQEDATGHFTGAYSLFGEHAEIEKNGYGFLASEGGRMAVGDDIDARTRSKVTLELSADGWADTVKSDERVYLKYGGAQTDGKVGMTAGFEGTIHMARVGYDARGASSEGVEGWSQWPEHPLSYVFPQEKVDDDPRTMSDLLAALRDARKLGSEDERNRDAAAVMQAIADKLVQSPGSLAEVRGAVLRAAPHDVEEAGVLIGALGTAGTPAAQQVLCELTADAMPTEISVRALTQLAFVKEPTPESIVAVTKTAGSPNEDLHNTSSLILGAMARSLGSQSADAARDVVAKLVERYNTTKSDEERVLLLSALGNTGSDAALPTLMDALGSDLAVLRLEAARGLRFMPPDPADMVLDRVLAQDKSTEVRKGAIFALGFRDLSRHEAIIGTILKDADAAVRLAMVEMLGASTTKFPGLRDLLKSVASSDPDPDVRAAASAYAKGTPNN